MVFTGDWCVDHPFAGRNTQQAWIEHNNNHTHCCHQPVLHTTHQRTLSIHARLAPFLDPFLALQLCSFPRLTAALDKKSNKQKNGAVFSFENFCVKYYPSLIFRPRTILLKDKKYHQALSQGQAVFKQNKLFFKLKLGRIKTSQRNSTCHYDQSAK